MSSHIIVVTYESPILVQ